MEKKKNYLNKNITSKSGESGGKGAHRVPRRSVTIKEENNSRIRRTRGYLMSNDIQADYTPVLNMLLELGYKVFISPWSDETKQTVRKYLLDTALVEEGAVDEFMDLFYKKLQKQLEKAEASKSV